MNTKTPCLPGTYNDIDEGKGISQCFPCPSGTYCPGNGTVTPTLCPNGKYSHSGASSLSECLPCLVGHYCTGGKMQPCREGEYAGSGSDFCVKCSPGNSCDGTVGGIAPCIAGTYNRNSSKCSPCEDSYYATDPGSSYCNICPRGSYCPNKTIAIECQGGDYCIEGTIKPIPCRIGHFCEDGSTQTPCTPGYTCSQSGTITQKPCPKGYYCADPSLEPLPCSVGTYGSKPMAATIKDCIPCVFPKTTASVASTDISQCMCDVGYYISENDSDECSKCEDGLLCVTLGNPKSNITSIDGYFYKSGGGLDQVNSTYALKCTPLEACLSEAQCNAPLGYQDGSFLCSKCIPGYYRSGSLSLASESSKCQTCNPSDIQNVRILQVTVICIFSLFIVLVVGCVVQRKVTKNSQPSEETTIISKTSDKIATSSSPNSSLLFRSVLSHLQITGIFSKFNFQWPSLVQGMYNMSDSVSSASLLSVASDMDIMRLLESSYKCLLYIPSVPIPFNELLVNVYILGVNVIFTILYNVGDALLRQRKDSSGSRLSKVNFSNMKPCGSLLRHVLYHL
jgi:hypothetical protein